jgi:hypothetical protein
MSHLQFRQIADPDDYRSHWQTIFDWFHLPSIIYAYDAYFLDCAARQKAPLLTLDRRLKASAIDFNIKTVEV